MTSGGNRKTTLDDLARLAGVSPSTVSRALNDHALISVPTKQRIWALAREHDYAFKSTLPRPALSGGGSISIVTPYNRGRPLPLSHPFFLELLASIGEAARARDCDFTVSHAAAGSLQDLKDATNTGTTSGVIFLGQAALHDAFNELADTKARFVVWGAHLPGQRYRSVGSDNVVGGRRATQHIARGGRRRILFLGGTDPEADQRRRGYLEALAASNIAVDNRLMVQVEFELESAERAVAQLIEGGVKFDGLFATSDLMALGAIKAIRRAGLSVPEDVSVVGYDDMLLARLSTPTLTTIRQDTYEAGRLMVASLLDPKLFKGRGVLPTELIVRESCGS
ncbi:DNA-binding LacI/PurR family transcriptional regulator [Brevundimonas nasdae]|jgi:DNA-binding LacI/PurR family transcriptional regulator|uniref:LacI family DNA-binding transcriptional regulator n=1 Tax=Brevundimonas nasdae TaxID=172043 RepID=UPI0019141140|nr:LacI family DNA-binding transcriptional regulator [Brevundimonas nasdae]MBK6025218.1 LacI family DNA-binding transcriptional regulator [Brevundimonas nasdae]MDQ0452000.1 DNA-binding LacI/PurR family transcriptional regulator [Brevundimonas nasdae]